MDYNKYVFHKLHKMPQVGRDPRERLLALCGGLLPGSWIILITLMQIDRVPALSLDEAEVEEDEAAPDIEGIKELVRSEVPKQHCEAGN